MLQAEVVLVNGRVFTNTGGRATAVALGQGRVLAVGTDDEALALRGPRTEVHDLRGRLATPGLTDSHIHLSGLARRLSMVELDGAHTLAEALRRVATRVKSTPKGEWVLGGGFDKNLWGDAFPTRHDLDAVAPDHPVRIHAHDGHTLWVNSLALKRCGVSRRTEDRPRGVVRRDAKGEPTGVFQEAAMSLIYDAPACPRGAVGPEELRRAFRHLLRYGLTSVHVMGEGDSLTSLQQLRERTGPMLRVTLYSSAGELARLTEARLRSGFGDEWLRLGGVKLLLDGTLGSQTAWMFAPHQNGPGGCGLPLMELEELRGTVRRAAEGGLACAIHAIGDRANAEALAALAEVRDLPTPLPHRIEHAQLLRPREVVQFAKLGVIASMQPIHIVNDAASADRYWGKRAKGAYVFASLERAGATLAFGSDTPVETADTVAGLTAAVERTPLGAPPGTAWYPEERLSLHAALRAYTLGPALASGEAAYKGKFAPGYLGDVVVFSEEMRGRNLRGARVDMVFVGGKRRYARPL